MIGEVIDADTFQSQVTGRWMMRFIMIVDNQREYGHVNLESSEAILLIARIANLWWPMPEQFKGKLFPMTQITFRNKTIWTLDWLQMRRIVKQERDQDEKT